MSAYRSAGGLLHIPSIHYRNAANVLTKAGVGRFRNAANALKTFFSAMAATIPETVSGFVNKPSGADVTTPSVAVTVTGGSGTLTYLWSRTDAAATTWTITAPTAAETAFKAVGVAAGDTEIATFKCTVTGSSGSVDSNSIDATAINLGGGTL